MNEEMTRMLIDLQKSIGEIDKNQAVAAEKIDHITDTVSSVKSDVADVKDDVKKVSEQVTNIDSRLSKIENKKNTEDYIVMGVKFAWNNKIARCICISLIVIGLNSGLDHYKLPSINIEKVLSFIV